MKQLLTIAILLTCMTALGSPVRADRIPVIQPVIGVPAIISNGAVATPPQCHVGNLNPSAFGVGGFILPPEEYALAFDPFSSCAVCQISFGVSAIHVVLQTGAACSIVMSVGIKEASYPNDPACPEPGIEWCTSDLITVEVPAAGLHDISVPLTCPCLTMDRNYLITFYISSASCGGGVPDLVTDASPLLCTNWNNYGSGPYDLLDAYNTWPGDLLFYAEAGCCAPPVPVERSTWGAIKSFYGD